MIPASPAPVRVTGHFKPWTLAAVKPVSYFPRAVYPEGQVMWSAQEHLFGGKNMVQLRIFKILF